MAPQKKVFCALRQQCTWDGRTHMEIIDSPVPPLLGRVEALEKEVRKISEKMASSTNRE